MDALIAFNNPLGQPLHFFVLEVLITAAFVITLRDALARARAGERHALFQWLTALCYGVTMELVAFNFLDNYNHAHFTVELYHHKLPLYVTFLYVVFHYTGWRVAERLKLGAAREALLAGFAMCLIDVPFDIAGIPAGWWRWGNSDPNLAVRWLGVPVTSYEWYLIFGAVYALIGRAMRERVNRRAALLALAPLAGLAVIVGGTIAFLPFHALHALGAPPGAIVAVHLASCAALAIAATPADPLPCPRAVAEIPSALGAFHLIVLAVLAIQGALSRAPVAFGAAGAAALGVVFLSHPELRRGRVRAPSVTEAS
jgi:hypothetical protein